MPKFSLEIGGQQVPLTLGDLSNINQDVKFIHQGFQGLQSNLGQLKDGSLGTVTVDGNDPCWKVGSTPVTFTLKANLKAEISLQSKGALFNYCTDFGGTNQVAVNCAANKVCVITAFHFEIGGNLKADAPLGATGVTVSGNASADLTYTVRHYKMWDPATTNCADAIKAALESFVLPLHSETAKNLSAGDCLYYEFDGAIKTGFGASYGVSTSVGGYSLSELGGVFTKVKGVADITSGGATVGLTVDLSAKFSWSRSFKAFLQKAANKVTLHIDAGKDSQRSVAITANGGITELDPPQLSVDPSKVTDVIKQRLIGNANPPANSIFTAAAGKATSALQDEVQKYVDDANDWLQGLFQKVGDHDSLSIGLLLQTTDHFVSAFTWDFDVDNGQFDAAWTDAVKGDFVAAMQTGAADLATGSGFEQLHYNNTRFSLALFGLASFNTVMTYFTQSDVRYAGKGIFYLEVKAGQVESTTSNKATSSTEIYLDATASGPPNAAGSYDASNLSIQLHGILAGNGNVAQAARLRSFLLSVLDIAQNGGGGGADLELFIKNWDQFAQPSKTGVTSVHLVFESSALKTIQTDTDINGRQSAPPHTKDKKNWDAYRLASDSVGTDEQMAIPDGYKSYDLWAVFNELSNGFTVPDGSGNMVPNGKPDRRAFGSGSQSNLEAFVRQTLGDTTGSIGDDTADEIRTYWSAGQQFMNLCDDVNLALTSMSAKAIDWATLSAELQKIAQDDIDAWFGASTLLGLAKASRVAQLAISRQGLLPSALDANVTIHLS